MSQANASRQVCLFVSALIPPQYFSALMTMHIVNEPGDSMQPGVFLPTVLSALKPLQYFSALTTLHIVNEPGR